MSKEIALKVWVNLVIILDPYIKLWISVIDIEAEDITFNFLVSEDRIEAQSRVLVSVTVCDCVMISNHFQERQERKGVLL